MKVLHALRYAAGRLTCERTTYCGMHGRPRTTYTYDWINGRSGVFKAIRAEESAVGITCKKCVRVIRSRGRQRVPRSKRVPKVRVLDEFDQWAYG